MPPALPSKQCPYYFRETLIKAFPRAEFALQSSKTAANSCASTGGSEETVI
jgi:hypothetical protein